MANPHRIAPEGATAAGKPKFRSGHVLVDVTTGRAELRQRIKAGEKVRILIVANIEGSWGVGRDDGTSIEFSATVESIRELSETDRV
jgi:hypothetical protein